MSLEFELDELRDWYAKITLKSRQKAYNRAEKLVHEVQAKIAKLEEVLELHFGEDTTMTDAADDYRKMIFAGRELLADIKPPSEVDGATLTEYKEHMEQNVREFNETVFRYGRLLVNLDRKSKNFSTKIRSLDDGIKRLSKQVEKFQKYYDGGFLSTLTAESVFDSIDRYDELSATIEEAQEGLESLKEKEKEINSQILELNSQIKELEQSVELIELAKVKDRLTQLRSEFDGIFVDIKKAFNKYLKAGQSRKLPMTDSDKQAMRPFTKDPLDALARSGGLQSLKSGLILVSKHIDKPILQLKKDRKQKLSSIIEEIDNGLLETRQAESVTLVAREAELRQILDELDLNKKIENLQYHIQSLEKEKIRMKVSLEREIRNAKEEAQGLREQLNDDVFSITQTRVMAKIPELFD